MASPIHHKEQLIINYIKKVTIEREAKSLGYRLKYGKYRNKSLHEMFQSRDGVKYILYLKNNTKNAHFKNLLKIAAREEIKLNHLL